MFFALVGFGSLTVVSGVFLAMTFAADWVIELHVIGALLYTVLTISHIWGRRKAARRAA